MFGSSMRVVQLLSPGATAEWSMPKEAPRAVRMILSERFEQAAILHYVETQVRIALCSLRRSLQPIKLVPCPVHVCSVLQAGVHALCRDIPDVHSHGRHINRRTCKPDAQRCINLGPCFLCQQNCGQQRGLCALACGISQLKAG